MLLTNWIHVKYRRSSHTVTFDFASQLHLRRLFHGDIFQLRYVVDVLRDEICYLVEDNHDLNGKVVSCVFIVGTVRFEDLLSRIPVMYFTRAAGTEHGRDSTNSPGDILHIERLHHYLHAVFAGRKIFKVFGLDDILIRAFPSRAICITNIIDHHILSADWGVHHVVYIPKPRHPF